MPTYEAKELGLNREKFIVEPLLSQSIIITGNEMLGAKLEVYNISGKVVLSQIVNSTNEQVPYNLSKGIYVVRLLNNDKAISRKISL